MRESWCDKSLECLAPLREVRTKAIHRATAPQVAVWLLTSAQPAADCGILCHF